MHIGLFDSGLGGLTVLRALQAQLPSASFTYLGDTARMPYGEKTPYELLKIAESNLHFLLQHNIDLLVIACSTVCAWTIHDLRRRHHHLPIIGMVEAGVTQAIKATRLRSIGILATRATVASKSYENQMQQQAPDMHCLSIAAPLLAPLIEEGLQEHPATKLLLRDYLAPLKQARIDTLLLGCTHYPPLLSCIAEEMGEGVAIVDPASSCAESCAALYHAHARSLRSPDSPPFQRFFVSQNMERFSRLGSAILGYSLPHIELVQLT